MNTRLLAILALVAAACGGASPTPAHPTAASAASAASARPHAAATAATPTAAAATAAPSLAATAPAAAANNNKGRFAMRVRADFFAGFQGDQARLNKAMAYCEKALAKHPHDPEAMVWHGTGLLFRSGQAFQSGDRARGTKLWNKGLAEMDHAVALAPNDLGVRIPRGAALLGVASYLPPAIAKPLLKKAVGDYERTLALQKSYFEHLPMHARGELLYGLADGWQRLGDHAKAKGYYERLLAEGKGTRYGKRARAWLDGHPEPAQTMQTCNRGCHVR